MIASTAVIHPNVKLGRDVIVEDFCIIGCPFAGSKAEETVIGDGSIIRSHTVVYAGNRIGRNFQTGHKANIRELNTIGDNVSIGTLSVVEHHVIIEDGVRIHSQAFVPEYSHLKRNCWIGPNAVLTNAKFPKSPDVKKQLKGPLVDESAKLGANSTVLPAVRIGKNALVGAGSVVTRDVEDHAVVAGNPAKFIRFIHY
jgi:acetyltransferase-like isoleucine patch superfamily enzyme